MPASTQACAHTYRWRVHEHLNVLVDRINDHSTAPNVCVCAHIFARKRHLFDAAEGHITQESVVHVGDAAQRPAAAKRPCMRPTFNQSNLLVGLSLDASVFVSENEWEEKKCAHRSF